MFQTNALVAANKMQDIGQGDALYAMAGVDQATRSVVVWRKGGASSPLYTATQALGMPVTFANAELTNAETLAQIDTINSHRDLFAAAGVTVTGVETDWKGPVILDVLTDTPAAHAAAAQPSLVGAHTVVVRQQDFIRAAAREDDYSPYLAGDRTAGTVGTLHDGRTGYNRCTSGFGGRGENGLTYQITAFHCVNPGDQRIFIEGHQLMGAISERDQGHDMAYVRTDTIPRTWDGPSVGTGQSKTVTAMMKPGPGARVCTSGSRSGVRCYATIGNFGHYLLTPDYAGPAYDAALWNATSNAEIAGEGDSGGPIFRPLGDVVTAVGMISAIGREHSECAGVATVCSHTVYFPDVYTEAFVNRKLDLTK